MKAIATTMAGFRARPLTSFGGKAVISTRDVERRTRTDAKGDVTALDLPASNVIAYDLEGGGRVMLRPSGTEPKIKYYFDHREELGPSESYEAGTRRAQRNLDELIEDFMQQTASRGGVV